MLAAIKKENKYLLTKRQNTDSDDRLDFNNKWQLPGGGINKGESIKKALLREVFEEVGLRVQIISGVPLSINSVLSKKERGLIFLCQIVGKKYEIRLNEEASVYGWFTLQQIMKLKTLPQVKESINAAAKITLH